MAPSSPRPSGRAERELATVFAGALQEVRDRRRWIARPWEFAFEVIGTDALADGANRHIDEFTEDQKAFLAAYCDRSVPKVILKTGRGGSKTFLKSIGIATFAYCVPRFTGTVLAGSLEQGRILYHYFERFAASERFGLCLDGPPTKTFTALQGGGWVRVLTASEKQVKGPHPMLLDIDEACAADEEILHLAMGQRAGSSLGLLRVASTPDKVFHVFRDWWSEADERGWKAFSWGARKVHPDGTWDATLPWLPRDIIEDLMRDNDANWVTIHIDGEFGSATGTVFRLEDVQAARIDDSLVRPIPEGMDPAKIDPLYNPEAITSLRTGVDWGFEHPTVLTTTARLQVPNWADLGLRGPDIYYVVHVEGHTQRSADFLYARTADVLQQFPGDIYLDSSHPFENQAVGRIARAARKTSHPVAFGKDKMAMVSHANMLLEQGRLRIPRRFTELLEQLAAYEWEVRKVAGRLVPAEKPRKLNDDYVDSLILSLWGHRLGTGPGAGRVTLRRGP